ADAPAIGLRALKASPVIIATDGREQSDPALIAGRIFAGDDPDALRVVTVVRPVALVSPEAGVPYFPEMDEGRRSDQRHDVATQIGRTWDGDAPRNIEVYDGDAATRLADLAHSANA